MSSAAPPAQELHIRNWFALLSVIATVAAVQALVLPRWPRVQPLSAAKLSLGLAAAGLDPEPLPTLPAARGYERSLSPVLGWKISDGAELRIVRGAVRQRDSFQVAFLGRDQPVLALHSRRLDWPLAGSAAGQIQGRPAYQTCLVAQSNSVNLLATTVNKLGRAVDQRMSGRSQTFKGLLGLQPNRSFDCILVSLRSSNKQPVAPHIWQQLLASLNTTMPPAASP